ncbi:MAG TPA: hypothetical protein VJ716_06405 [Gaiellaceae bacterium]|nr:hypothetical protein [Gaiellaceae bacterium]
MVVTNTSGAACSLPAPQVTVLSGGKTLPLKDVHGQTFGSGPVVHSLQPGKSAEIDFAWQNWCGRPSLRNGGPYTETLRLRLGGALTVTGLIRRPDCLRPGAPSTIEVAEPRAWAARKL